MWIILSPKKVFLIKKNDDISGEAYNCFCRWLSFLLIQQYLKHKVEKLGLPQQERSSVVWVSDRFLHQPTLSTNHLFLYLKTHRELYAQKAILPMWLKLRKRGPVEEISSWIRCNVVCRAMAWTNWNTYHFYTQSCLVLHYNGHCRWRRSLCSSVVSVNIPPAVQKANSLLYVI